MQKQDSKGPIFGIDVARFFAATCVVFYHLAAKPYISVNASTVATIVNPRAAVPAPMHAPWWGWVGVQVFFVISGVVISFSAEQATASRFLIGRITRLWPAIFVAIILIAPLNLIFWKHGPALEFLAVTHSLLLLPVAPWVTGQMWTLPVEAIFYGAVWLVITLGWRRKFYIFARFLGIYSSLFWIIVAYLEVTPENYFQISLVWHGLYFSIGMLIMRLAIDRATFFDGFCALLCLIGAWFEISTTLVREVPASTVDATAPYAIWFGAVVFLTASTIWRDPVMRVIKKLKLVTLFRQCGLLTYPLYLLHVQIGALAMKEVLSVTCDIWLSAVCGYLVAICAAGLYLKFADRPLTSMVQAFAIRLAAHRVFHVRSEAEQ